jgi:hypothetical protein
LGSGKKLPLVPEWLFLMLVVLLLIALALQCDLVLIQRGLLEMAAAKAQIRQPQPQQL